MFPPTYSLACPTPAWCVRMARKPRRAASAVSSIYRAASLCPKEGKFLRVLTVWVLPVTVRLRRLRSDLRSLPLALAGQRPQTYNTKSTEKTIASPDIILTLVPIDSG
jgi:hypothetical protein